MMESADQVKVVKLLLRLGDLKQLGNVALLDLANTAHIETLDKGESLSAEQQHKSHLYLIEGSIELRASGKLVQTLVAGTARALSPLFRVHTHGLVATCLTPVKLLALNEDTVNRYVANILPRENDGIQVKEYADSEQEPSIIGEIRHVFHHNEVDLPSLPEVALRVNKAVNDPKQNLHVLALEVQADPLIAARVIQVANSALYTPLSQITSVQNAIGRIGIKALQTIVMSVVLGNLFKPKSQLIHKRTRAWYSHSIRVGAIAHILANHLSGFEPEHAFLAGLLHDIGVMPILILADQRGDLDQEPDKLEQSIRTMAGFVGGMLLRQWQFGGDLLTVVEEAQLWQREVETADYCDLIQVAQLHCHLVGGNNVEAPPLVQLPAFRRLQLQGIDPLELIQEARAEIHEIIRLLILS